MSMIIVADSAPPRHFATDADLAALVAEFEARTLAKREWSHMTHLAVSTYSIHRDGLAATQRDLPDRIRRFNDTTGVPNNDERGYHETITQFFLVLLKHYLDQQPPGTPVSTAANALKTSPLGDKNIAFQFYSRDRLLSIPARRGWLDPDLRPLTDIATLAV